MAAGSPLMVRLLVEQRKRCLATILNSAESSPWWRTLTDEQKNAHRDQVRSALNVFYDFTRDLLKVTDDDGTTSRNDLALELIQSIHTQQMKLHEQLAGIGVRS